jgi:hypothetical protein
VAWTRGIITGNRAETSTRRGADGARFVRCSGPRMPGLMIAFWILLWLPGFRFARRSGWLEGELAWPSYVALGSLGSFALLAPVITLGYLLRLPLWVLSVALCVSVAAAVADTLRELRGRSWRRPALEPVAVIGTLVLLADAWLGVCRGGHLGGDAMFHIARVRMLLDHGFNNWDPYIAGNFFSRVYHGSVYHALLAAFAQLGRTSAHAAWIFALPWAKWAIAGGTFHACYVVLGQRTLAWLAALSVSVGLAPVAYLVYPNKLAPLWLLPLALAAVVQLFQGVQVRASLGMLACASVTLALVHPLYAAFALLGFAPVFALQLAVRLVSKRETRSALSQPSSQTRKQALLVPALALAALLACAPWLLATRFAPVASGPVPRSPTLSVTLPAAEGDASHDASDPRYSEQRGVVHRPDGTIVLHPRALWSFPSGLLITLAVIALGFRTERRRSLEAVFWILLGVTSMLYVPWFCTWLTKLLGGSDWVITRFKSLRTVCSAAVFPWVLVVIVANLLRPRLPAWWLRARGMAGLACAVAVVVWSWQTGIDTAGADRDEYLAGWRGPQGVLARLTEIEADRAFFAANLKRGQTVAVTLRDGPKLAASYDLWLVASPPSTGSPGIPQLPRRRSDLAALLSPELPQADRAALLAHYRVRYLYVKRSVEKALRAALRGKVVRQVRHRGSVLLELDTRQR